MKRKRSSCSDLDLTDDCWELVLRFLEDDDRQLKSVSVVSKQLLSISNRLRFSLKICYGTVPFLPRLVERFTELTSLDLTCFHGDDLNALLSQISCFRFNHLTSLNLSNQPTIPADGLRAFSLNNSSITTLICSRIKILKGRDLHVIADCFPLLEELDLSNPVIISSQEDYNNGIETLSLSLVKLRKVNLSDHSHINDQSLYHLFNNCKNLNEAIMLESHQLTVAGISSALAQRPSLTSLSLSPFLGSYLDKLSSVTSHFILGFNCLTYLHLCRWHIPDILLCSIAMETPPPPLRTLILRDCTGYTYSGLFSLLSKCPRLQHLGLPYADFLQDHHVAELSSLFLAHLVFIDLSHCFRLTQSSLFALNTNCPSLVEIKIEVSRVHHSISEIKSVVNPPQLKYLKLACNFSLSNHKLILLASIFPNLHLIDLTSCISISEEGVRHLLSTCSNIRELKLAHCPNVKSLGINFQVPKLEVLNLEETIVDDEALLVISKSCPGLLQLILSNCKNITDSGVMQVVKNCTQLREINLQLCHQVQAKVIASIILLRPSLRKITPPPDFPLSDRNRKLFSRHGCLLQHGCLPQHRCLLLC